MKGSWAVRILIPVFVALAPVPAHGQEPPEAVYLCTVYLKPVREMPNAQGMALITKVQRAFDPSAASPIRERGSIGVYADWMPPPSSFGDYDQFEGFVQIPGVISWRLKLYPIQEETPSWFGGTPWAGKFDEITAKLPPDTRIEVRLSNSATGKLGAPVLHGTLQGCRPAGNR